MENVPIIGVAGKARTGKDTLARLIVAERGGYQYSFAEPLKAMLNAGLGIDANDPYWIEHKEDPIPALDGASLRKLMQTLGTEWGRNMITPHIWINMARQRLISMGPGMVISDVRFEEEAQWVRSMGGLIIHLYRYEAPTVREHASETELEVMPGDAQIVNSGSLQTLQTKVKDLLGLA